MSDNFKDEIESELFLIQVVTETARTFRDQGLTPCQAITKMAQRGDRVKGLMDEWNNLGFIDKDSNWKDFL